MTKPAAILFSKSEQPYQPLARPPLSHKLISGIVQLKPGENVGEHSTENYEEMLVVLEGEGRSEIEGFGSLNLNTAQTIYIPPQTKHNIYNTGEGVLRYIFIVTPVD